MNGMLERNLPPHLAYDIDVWNKSIEEKPHLLDCLWGELYGFISITETNNGASTIANMTGFKSHDFIAQSRDGVLAPSLTRILPHIDLAAIGTIIGTTPYFTDLRRQFYKTYLAARHKAMFG